MGIWLLIIILAYLFFGIAYFGDKLVLSGHPSPKVYTFYIGLLNALTIFLIPFVGFSLPKTYASFAWVILDAIVFISGMYLLFLAVKKFEVSEVMPIIGALQPIFIFGIIWILFGPQPIKLTDMAAFTILILGGFLISFEKFIKAHLDYVKLIAASSLMFSLDFVFLKMIFISMPFWHGLIWSRIFIFLIAMLFLFSKNFRKEVFEKKVITNKKSVLTFFFTQSTGAIAGVLQSFAIALVPVSYLAIMNSLKGLQYVFLFLITVIFSLFFPKILSEKISKKVIIQKTAVILIISFGLAILFIN